MSKYLHDNNPIYIDGTDIPKNRLGITDAALLHEIEARLLKDAYTVFLDELSRETIFDEAYFKFKPLTDTGGGSVHEKEKALLAEIIARVNELFQGELTDDDRLVYVNNVLKGKLLESDTLAQQATNNTKEQFSNSPDLKSEIMNAIMDAFAAHSTMSKQALDSEKVREGLRDIMLGPAQLYEALRERAVV